MSVVFRSLEEAAGQFGPSALTIGNFDGVHIGHQQLIREAREQALARGCRSGVLTFHPHPRTVVSPHRTAKLLASIDERLALLQNTRVDQILVLPFTPELANLSADLFVRQILVQALETRFVVVGDNFRFGHKQGGDPALLASLGGKLGFETLFVPQIRYRGEPVSSSLIREHLQQGHVARAGRLLGRCYGLSGPVVSGHGIGSKRTVPTLNLRPSDDVLPANGVYITEVHDLDDGRRWPSITNIGTRPTFDGDDLTIESYLLSPLAGGSPKNIRVDFRRWVRAEQKFPDPMALKAQILRDVSRANAYWRRTTQYQLNRMV
ncbi:MAG: bifunctional riboflavin kinase/FAD synthetase [Bryobacteraceae bacterium]